MQALSQTDSVTVWKFGDDFEVFIAGIKMDQARSFGFHHDAASEIAPIIPGQATASPSNTQGKSRMRESRTYGSVQGAFRKERPYRDLRVVPCHGAIG
jgi:hypothetical protein